MSLGSRSVKYLQTKCLSTFRVERKSRGSPKGTGTFKGWRAFAPWALIQFCHLPLRARWETSKSILNRHITQQNKPVWQTVKVVSILKFVDLADEDHQSHLEILDCLHPDYLGHDAVGEKTLWLLVSFKICILSSLERKQQSLSWKMSSVAFDPQAEWPPRPHMKLVRPGLVLINCLQCIWTDVWLLKHISKDDATVTPRRGSVHCLQAISPWRLHAVSVSLWWLLSLLLENTSQVQLADWGTCW